MKRVEFTVVGEPAPQGSKTVGRNRAGGSYMREANPATKSWRNAIAAHARKAMTFHSDDGTAGYEPPLLGPVELIATFVFRRPKKDWGTGRNAGTLKPNAQLYCATRPDLDKLVRAVGDAVTGIVVVDDAQLVVVRAEKHYGSPCAHLRFTKLEENGGAR